MAVFLLKSYHNTVFRASEGGNASLAVHLR